MNLKSLEIQYNRYMNISRSNMKNQQMASEMYSITRNQPNQNYSHSQHKTQRKNSLQNRVCLGELPLNRFDSGSKQSSANLKRQNSIEMKMSNNKNTNINGSRWLDNQKEMMQFILNLKSKKSDTKSNKNKKYSQGFQIAESGMDKEELLCNRMLSIKRIEKHEKEAISHFYEKEYERCFEELSKAENLMRKQRIDSQQHQLYINYLYAQFYYKLQNGQKWKGYLLKAKSLVNRLSNQQNTSMKEYIQSIKALEVCLALQEEQFQKTLRLIDQIKSSGKLSSKIRRRIINAQITASRKLCRFKLALELIDKQCETLENDEELNEEKRELQFSKLLQLKVQITVQFVSNQKAIDLIESAIGFKEVANSQKPNFSYYNLKIYEMFAELLKKNENQKIKLIFFYQKWAQFQTCKKQKLKVQLELFKTYYDLGIYEKAIQLFDSISSENVVYLGPQYLFMFANIKHFHGDTNEAVGIVTKIIDICQDDDARGLYLFKILEFNLQELAQDLRAEREMLLQNFLKSVESGTCSIVIELYSEYLKKRGEGDRLKKMMSNLKKAGNFNFSHILQLTTNRRKIGKK